MDCVAVVRRMLGITGDWSTTALVPCVWYSIVWERGCRFIAAWVRGRKGFRKPAEEEKSGRGGQGQSYIWGDC